MADDKIPVFVSIIPQKYFVQQIGKTLVDVHVMVQPGASPATYEPKPGQMVALSKAKIYFAIGVPFENTWLKKIAAANSHMRVVHTEEGIQKIPMEIHHHDKSDTHYIDENPHQSDDPHIWLSPSLVKIQARTILKAFREIDPSNGPVYQANYEQFIANINSLDEELKKRFSTEHGRRFMVFHPSWGYFAREYGLTQIPVEVEGKNPKPAQLKDLIAYAKKLDIKIILTQPQFSTKSAGLVAKEINGTVAYADPLDEDWPANLRKVANTLKAALK